MYETLIKINEIMDAKKVLFITEISGKPSILDDPTGFDRDCIPITLLKKDRLTIADKMHNKKLKVSNWIFTINCFYYKIRIP